jgi:hypothetical protein
MPRNSTSVDHSALRFNQAMIIALLCLGFIIDRWWERLLTGRALSHSIAGCAAMACSGRT